LGTGDDTVEVVLGGTDVMGDWESAFGWELTAGAVGDPLIDGTGADFGEFVWETKGDWAAG
jgi:hypothetical protein